jgi:hypothetical protein
MVMQIDLKLSWHSRVNLSSATLVCIVIRENTEPTYAKGVVFSSCVDNLPKRVRCLDIGSKFVSLPLKGGVARARIADTSRVSRPLPHPTGNSQTRICVTLSHVVKLERLT